MHKEKEIAPAIRQTEARLAQHQVPVVIEVILQSVTNIALGTEIDNVVELEELPKSRADAPTALSMLDQLA